MRVSLTCVATNWLCPQDHRTEIVGRVIGRHFSRPLHDQFINFPIIRPPHDHILIRPTVGPIVHLYDIMIVNTTLTQPHMPCDQPYTQHAQRIGKYSSLSNHAQPHATKRYVL